MQAKCHTCDQWVEFENMANGRECKPCAADEATKANIARLERELFNDVTNVEGR